MKLSRLFCILVAVLGFGINHAKAQAVALPSFADLAEGLMPSVVNISTLHDKDTPEDEGRDIETNVQSIFNAPKTNKVSLGSGFIIDETGYIITNNHVIDKAKSIAVVLSDGREIEAKVIGTDEKTDIALIKIETKQKLKPVTFGNSDNIRVGDWILAIGNPFGLGSSVTAGIISAKSRDIESGPYDSFIQTDASINQGNSGGPMFNLKGEVIGINSAIFSTSGGSMGIGFAIPINLAEFVIKQLKTNGQVKRGWIGVKMQPNSLDMAMSLGLNQNQGAVISAVSEQSSAAKAGIKPGDIILKFDGHEIDSTKNLSRIVAETVIAKSVEVEIWRNNQRQKLNIMIEEMPMENPVLIKKEYQDNEAIDTPQTEIQSGVQSNSDWGITVENITPENRNRYNLADDSAGVIVALVSAMSDAAAKGLKSGDIITQIDKKPVVDAEDVKRFLNDAANENKRPALLQIKDGEQLHFVAVKFTAEKNNEPR